MKRFVVALCLLVCSTSWGQAAVPCVNKYVTNPHVTQHQFSAMVDFTYNVGCGNFRKSTLLKKFNQGDLKGTTAEFMKWTYVGKKQLPGLVRRRTMEVALFEEK